MRKLAGKYVDEMGGLKTAFESYLKKWPSPASIQQNKSSFCDDTKAVFHAIHQRIERENTELYSKVDSLA